MLKGIYALNDVNKPIPSAVLAAKIDGVALRYTWDLLATSFGLGEVEAALDECHAAGKHASLCIQAGRRCPPSLYVSGAQKFEYIDAYVSWLPDASIQTCPVPWDPVFLEQWTGFVVLLSTLASHPALAAVKITGVNGRTEESSLPMHWGGWVQNPVTKHRWQTSNDVHHWLSLGYNRSKVYAAWDEIVRAFQIAFPATQLVAQIVKMAWPPIGDGTLDHIGSGNDDVLQQQVIARLPTWSGLQSNDLCAYQPINPVVAATTGSLNIGQQALWPVTGDATYRCNDGVPAPPEEILGKMMANAKGCQWIEMYPQDLPHLQGVAA